MSHATSMITQFAATKGMLIKIFTAQEHADGPTMRTAAELVIVEGVNHA